MLNIVDPIEINENFKKIYEKLYGSEIGPNTSEMNNFLDKIHIPKISEIINGELFADYVIIFLKKMEESIAELLELLNIFGKISGYKLN